MIELASEYNSTAQVNTRMLKKQNNEETKKKEKLKKKRKTPHIRSNPTREKL